MLPAPARSVAIAIAVVGSAMLLAGCVLAGPLRTGDSGRNASVQPEVLSAAAVEGSVAVIASLRPPPALAAAKPDVATLRAQVATSQAPVLAALPAAGAQLLYRYQAVPALALRVNERALDALARRADVIDIALDEPAFAATNQSLPLINADDAHTAGVTGEGVIVAVLDTGIDTDHPDLAGDLLYERCFLTGGGCPPMPHPAEDDQGHGTNVSGIVTSEGIVAPKGVAPDAKIAAYKVLNSGGAGSSSDWLAALDDIIANHPEVDLVNMSLQSNGSCPGGATTTAIATARALGIATFIAAGNQGSKNQLMLPACIAEAISVGAVYDTNLGPFSWMNGSTILCTDTTTAADDVACWSSSDNTLDLLAPGALISSTGLGGGISNFRGTSQASPHAAGVAALILEAQPGLTVDQIEARMEATGKLLIDDLNDGNTGTSRTTPRIDARVALLHDTDDDDGDGCSNLEEYGTNAALGGRRNPLNVYDFYDVSGDRVVNVFDDVLSVIQAFGPLGGPNYQPQLDRSRALPGADVWDMGPPDSVIDVNTDIRGVAAQFGHSCAAPP